MKTCESAPSFVTIANLAGGAVVVEKIGADVKLTIGLGPVRAILQADPALLKAAIDEATAA